jgi:ATP citrate (pro-S)-lyase
VQCATADPDGRKRALLIGGGIANFTDVAATFSGIIRALREKVSWTILLAYCSTPQPLVCPLKFFTNPFIFGLQICFQESKLKAARMNIYVRRGGPNYQTGLAKMRRLGAELGVPIEV